MNPTPFPTVTAWPLPTEALRTPLPEAASVPSAEANAPEMTPDPAALTEAIAPLISAAIARRARQRRYTG